MASHAGNNAHREVSQIDLSTQNICLQGAPNNLFSHPWVKTTYARCEVSLEDCNPNDAGISS